MMTEKLTDALRKLSERWLREAGTYPTAVKFAVSKCAAELDDLRSVLAPVLAEVALPACEQCQREGAFGHRYLKPSEPSEVRLPRVWNPFEATKPDSPFEYDQGDVVLIAYDDLYDLVHHRDEMSDRAVLAGRAETPQINVDLLRGNCHATFNGGWDDDKTIEAFHHGMDTVCNVLEDHLKGGFANGVLPQRPTPTAPEAK